MRAVPWADEAEQQLSRLAPSGYQLFGDIHILEQGCERSLAVNTLILRLRLKFEVARQASNPSLSASARAVPWADEAEQQFSRLAPSDCQLSADVTFFAAALRQAPARMPEDMFKVSGGRISKQPLSP